MTFESNLCYTLFIVEDHTKQITYRRSLISEEVRKSKIEESFRIIFSTYGNQIYVVRAKDRDECDNTYPDDLEVLSEESEQTDSEHQETVRILTGDEDRERLALHKLWKDKDPEGEQYYAKGLDNPTNVAITSEHHGAVFEDCAFGNYVTFEGIDFNKIAFIGCTFGQDMARLNNCTGLIEKEEAKAGELWFQHQYNRNENKYTYEPVIVMKYNTINFGTNKLKTDFVGINKDGEQFINAYNVVKEIPNESR